MKRILFIEFEPIGGPPHRMWELANYLIKSDKHNWDIKLITDNRSVLKNENNINNVQYETCDWTADFHLLKGLSKLKTYIKTLVWLANQVIIYKPDIIYCNHYQWVDYCTPLALIFNKLLYIHLRDYWKLETKFAIKMLSIWPKTYYIGISKFVIKTFQNEYKLPNDRTKLIYDGILSPKKESSKLRNKKVRKTIVAFSRLEPKRNLQTFVDVAEILCRQHNNLIFKHYGFVDNPENKKYLRELTASVNESGYRKRILFLPYVKSDRLEKIYSNSYLSIITSPEFALPNSAIESLFYKVPVIACNGSGNSEVIKHNVNGLLVSRATTFFFVDAINHYLKDDSSYQSSVAESLKSVQTKFDALNSYKKIENYLFNQF